MGWGEPSCYHVFCLTLSPFRDFLHLPEVLKECLFLNSDCHCKGPETCCHMLRNKSFALQFEGSNDPQDAATRNNAETYFMKVGSWSRSPNMYLVGKKNIGHIVTSLWIQVIIYLFFYPKCLGK